MIKIDNLLIKYGKRIILKNICFEINKSDRIAILGKNGAGKTTLVEAISGCRKYQSGKISFEPNKKDLSIRCVFQDVDYDSELKLWEIYKYYFKLFGVKISDKKIFEKYDLSLVINRKYSSLSGGERQKFKLLMCLEAEPKTIILDEVTTSLDFLWRQQIIKIIKEYLDKKPDTSLLLVSHDPKEVMELCNSFFLIEDRGLKKINDINIFFNNLITN